MNQNNTLERQRIPRPIGVQGFTHLPPALSWVVDTAKPVAGSLPQLNEPAGLGHSFSRIAATRPQAKLTVNHPGDAYEVEADRMADRVMRMPATKAETSPVNLSSESAVQRKCAACEDEEATVSREEEDNADPGVAADPDVTSVVDEGVSSGGEPLDSDTRSFMEPRFGHDFSQVRVHTDAKASRSAAEVNAFAYTVGQDVVFRSGQYAPGTSEGKRLLAHELTHVVQQGGSSRLGAVQRDADDPSPDGGTPAADAEPDAGLPVDVPDEVVVVENQGEPAFGQSVSLKGTTTPFFHSDINFASKTATTSKDCTGCKPPKCVHITGTLKLNFSVRTVVVLPRVADIPGLTPCQKKKAQDAIDNTLSPHEQQHVSAFHTYDGSVTQAFDQTLCKSEVNGALRAILNAVNDPRQAAAQAASDALDPFNFTFDVTCDEPKTADNNDDVGPPSDTGTQVASNDTPAPDNSGGDTQAAPADV